jgi:hypothetical protein
MIILLDDAVQIHQDIQAYLSVGVHWGTFLMSDEASKICTHLYLYSH